MLVSTTLPGELTTKDVAAAAPVDSPKGVTNVTLYWYVPLPNRPETTPRAAVGAAEGTAIVYPAMVAVAMMGIPTRGQNFGKKMNSAAGPVYDGGSRQRRMGTRVHVPAGAASA